MAELSEILAEGVAERSGQPRDEHGRFASATPADPEAAAPTEAPPTEPAAPTPPPEPPVAAPVAAAPAPAPVEDDRVPQAALLDERRKRQQAERQVAELLQQREPPAQPAAPELPADIWENPQGYVQGYVENGVQTALRQADEKIRNMFVTICEMRARDRYTDYDATRDSFLAAVKEDPVLQAEFARATDPAEFAYKTGKSLKDYQTLKQVGDPQAYRQKVEAEIRAQIAAEQQPTPAPINVPKSLNAETSAPTAGNAGWRPPPLEAILKRN